MKKVQIVKRYSDMQLNRRVMQGEVLEVSDERAGQLVGATVAIILTEAEEVSTEAPLKTPEEIEAPQVEESVEETPAEEVQEPKEEKKSSKKSSAKGSKKGSKKTSKK